MPGNQNFLTATAVGGLIIKKSHGNKGVNMLDLIILLLKEGYTESFLEALEILEMKEKPCK